VRCGAVKFGGRKSIFKMKPYLQISDLRKSFPSRDTPNVVIDGFNLEVARGEFVALIGHSGCGKSTVLSMVAGLSEADSGAMILAGRELRGAGPDRGVVFQSPSLLPWRTAFENVLLGVDQAFYTATPVERRQIAEYYLSVVGLAEALEKRPSELSQGMRQRVGIARAFALSPKMLLLDEPFGMLDALTRIELQQVLVDLWKRERITALLVTHDVDEAIFLADRVVGMTDGPGASVGMDLAIPFPHPRNRELLLGDPDFDRHRREVLSFLETGAHQRRKLAKGAVSRLPKLEQTGVM
jgi:nitrate/nitrite transport system ATP-binding protein